MKVTREQCELWSRMWHLATRPSRYLGSLMNERQHPTGRQYDEDARGDFNRFIDELKKRFPDICHSRVFCVAGDPYFNIGQAEAARCWQDVYDNGF